MASYMQRNGRVTARVRKGGRTKAKTFNTKGAAVAWALKEEAAIARISQGEKLDVRSKTVADMIDAYLSHVDRGTVPVRSQKLYSLEMSKRHLGHVRLGSLTKKELIDYALDRAAGKYGERRNAAAGPQTLHIQFSILGGVFRCAYMEMDWDVPLQMYDEFMYAIGKRGSLKLRGRSQVRKRIMLRDEESALITYFSRRNDSAVPMPDLVRFSCATAVRLGELVRLRWEDIDHDRRRITIRERKHPDPTVKATNDVVIPLLGNSYEIAMAQPRTSEFIFPYRGQTISEYFRQGMAKCEIEGKRPVPPL